MSEYTFGLFVKDGGPIIHIPTGLPLAPYINQEFELSGETMDTLMAVTEIYTAHLQRLLEHPDYMINMRAVDKDFRQIYEAPAQAAAELAAKSADMDEFFAGTDTSAGDEPAEKSVAGGMMSDEALQMVLGAHQATLDKDSKKSGQVATAVYGIKTLQSGAGKRGLSFMDEEGEELFAFWDNSDGNKDEKWKNPYSKFPKRETGTALWESEPRTRFTFTRPMFIAIKRNGEFVNFQSVLQWDGEMVEA